jgi:hypothetical protein
MEFDLSVCAPTDFGGARNQNDLNILPATDFIGKLRKLTACESGVWSFVHLFQVRQCIRSEFISVVLSSSAECVDISNNFLSGLRHPLGVQLAGQPVGVQCPVNYFIHRKLRKILHCDCCNAAFPSSGVKQFLVEFVSEVGFRSVPAFVVEEMVGGRAPCCSSRINPQHRRQA